MLSRTFIAAEEKSVSGFKASKDRGTLGGSVFGKTQTTTYFQETQYKYGY